MRGNLTRRGKNSWRIKFDVGRDPITGKRETRFITMRGTRKDAERELTRLLGANDGGVFVEPTKMTVAAYLDHWLDNVASMAVTPNAHSNMVLLSSPTFSCVCAMEISTARIPFNFTLEPWQ